MSCLVTLVVANAWLKMLKNPTRNWSFCWPVTAKFLNSVRSWFCRVGVRRSYGGSTCPVSPKAGNPMQLMSKIFSPTLLPSSRGSHV